MDLESECSGSALESVEDNGEVTPQSSILADESYSKLENGDGSCKNEIRSSNFGQVVGKDPDLVAPDSILGIDIDSRVDGLESPPLGIGSPGIHGNSSPVAVLATTKGYGLKKWRRIKRDFTRDSSPIVDALKVLKRESPSSANPMRGRQSGDANHMSEGSVGSVNITAKHPVVADYFAAPGSSNLNSGVAFGASMNNSEDNSEDQSSKSSTAASAPKLRHDMPKGVSGSARERNRMKNFSGNSLGNIMRGSRGTGLIEISKKARGEKIKIENENSHSSMESDSRSSNFVFLQGACSATSNGVQVGRSVNHDGEDSDEVRMRLFDERHQARYRGDHRGQVGNFLQDGFAAGLSWEPNEERSENNEPSTVPDPLVESVIMLQSVQEALETEVKKLGEIGRENVSACETFVNGIDPEHCEPSSSDQLDYEGRRQNASRSMEKQVLSFKDGVNVLESKVQVAAFSNTSQKGESGSVAELQQEKCEEMESEVEALFKQKIEAEIEYLAITQKLQVASEDQEALLDEQRAISEKQVQLLDKLKEAEGKIAALSQQVEDQKKTYSEDILGTEEVLRVEKRVCKVTSYCFVQLILLAVAFGLIFLRLPSEPFVVVPT